MNLNSFVFMQVNERRETFPLRPEETNLERFCVGNSCENQLFFVSKKFKLEPISSEKQTSRLIQSTPEKVLPSNIRVGLQETVDWGKFGIKMRVLSIDITKFPITSMSALRNLTFQTLYDQVRDTQHDDLFIVLKDMYLGASNAEGKVLPLMLSEPIQPFLEGNPMEGRLYLAKKGYSVPPLIKAMKTDRLSVVTRSNPSVNEVVENEQKSFAKSRSVQSVTAPNSETQTFLHHYEPDSRSLPSPSRSVTEAPAVVTHSSIKKAPMAASIESQSNVKPAASEQGPGRSLLVNLDSRDFNWAWIGIDPPILKMEVFPGETCQVLRHAILEELSSKCPSDLKEQLLARAKSLCLAEKNIETNQVSVLRQNERMDEYLEGAKLSTYVVYFMQVRGIWECVL